MSELDPFLTAMDLRAVAPGLFRGEHLTGNHGVVFGGQLLGQMIVAAARTIPDKQVRSLHTIFARGASPEQPLDISVETMHAGRAFASTTVTVSQGDRLCCRALVLLDAAEPDLIRHATPAPDVPGPDALETRTAGEPWWQTAVVGGVDVSDPDAVGPAELHVWSRFLGAPDDPVISQALLAYASDGWLIGTAMRPHPGVGQSLAHVSISTTVLDHTLTFHERFHAGEWLLLAQESPYAGRGRSYGRALVYDASGALVASFVQDNMIRDYPQGQAPAAGGRAKY